ncbi:hypothetical protein NKG99_20615 [Mesorhizobium sp. M1409]|uniref:hypothetical protein n=1 Tax=Mesorhizobium sp. M1409 TaxID=2957100 RepID=UPI003337DEFA
MTMLIDQLVPGGIRPSDRIHWMFSDQTCSRCRADTSDDVPLMLMQGDHMLIYCEECLDDRQDQ